MTTLDDYPLSPDTRALNRDKLRAIPVDEWPGETMGTHWDGCEAVHEECAAVRAAKVSEHDMQASLFDWRDKVVGQVPELRWLMAIPNGQYRPGQRPEPGINPGAPDVLLPVFRYGREDSPLYGGLWIELKVGNNAPTFEQKSWLEHLRLHQYKTALVYDDWREAARIILDYLDREDVMIGLEATDETGD